MTSNSHAGDGRCLRRWRLLAGAVGLVCVAIGLGLSSRGSGAAPVDATAGFARSVAQREPTVKTSMRGRPLAADPLVSMPDVWAKSPRARLRFSRTLSVETRPEPAISEAESHPVAQPTPVLREHTITVRSGDSLYKLFKARGLDGKDLAAIMALGKPARILARLRPGDRILVYSDENNRVQGLGHERAGGKRLDIARDGERFRIGAEARPANAVIAAEEVRENSNDWLELHKPTPRLERRMVLVGNGDSLYSIFKKNGLPLSELAAIVASSEDTRRLARLTPGQRIEFHLTSDNGVSKLVHYLDETRTLHVQRNGIRYDSKLVDVPLDRHVATAKGVIDASLFVAGQRAGLSNNVIMQLVEIFGWDVDFALDIRAGDRFAVVYEELYKDGEKLRDGSILAASFTNQGKTTRIVRYVYPDGRSAYFTPDGVSIRKAFLRTPVNYSRISSRFSLRRKHPILHKFRAHRGVDYAAPRGTPVKATGDGKVVYIGYKGGYGKTIVLRHGATYSTLYAHMSRFARGLRPGRRVSQGQTIGYVGSTGLSSGPHLHYEFRVRGVHRNPLRVKLPKAAPIEKKHKQHFLATTGDMVARLEFVNTPTLAADERRLTEND